MAYLRPFIFVLALFGGAESLAQNTVPALMNSAEKNRLATNFSQSLKLYKQVLEIEPQNIRALDAITDIYLYNFQVFDSARIYLDRRVAVPAADTNYIVYYKLADCMRMQEQHTDALKYYHFYQQYGITKKMQKSEFYDVLTKNIDYSQNALTNKELIYEPYYVENLGFFVNSVEAEYTPVFIEADSLLLYNARYKDYEAEQMSDDNKYFENIYYFDLRESVASTYNEDIDQRTHQAVVSRSYGSDTIIIFFQNKVWLTSFGNDRLDNLVPMPDIFQNYYFQPHGFFSADHKTFIFSARVEYGNLDLFISHFENGAWTAPQPISPRINSGFDEDSPYLSKDGNTLYFSSRGHNSSGGYDFFVSNYVNGEWSAPVNMGYPMNSAGDDIYLSWNEDGRGGFFSSNRNGGFGNMDIYTFSLVRKTIDGTTKDKQGNIVANATVKITDNSDGTSQFVTSDEMGKFSLLVDPEKVFNIVGTKEKYFDGKVIVQTYGEQGIFKADIILEKDPGISLYLLVANKETKEPIDSVKVKVVNNMTGEADSVMTSLTGDYLWPLADKKLNDRGSYNFTVSKEGFLAKTITFNVLFDHEGKYNVHEFMDITLEKVEVGNDLSKIIALKPIYFDLGKWAIRPDAAIELDKIVKVMNDNPQMIVELGSHTDSRGSASSNLTLSAKRAKSSVDYIKARISNPERLSGVGYGETKPTNECTDGVTCPEEKHQENRRTEFIIISM
jgi:outer membrane protein OmpA-like peptidoglycan-associated protein